MISRVIASVFAALVLVPAASAIDGRIVSDSFASTGLGGRLSFQVYLPPGYDGGSARYPVVYYLHGLPAGAASFRAFGFVTRALEQTARRAIVVAPQGAKNADRDPEYLDWGAGREWETAIADELPRVVDNRYRTIPTRNGRAIVGVSAGGYGAMNIGLHHLAGFAAIESWSGYFRPTNLSGTQTLPREPDATISTLVQGSTNQIAAANPFIGFYVGDHDARFRGDNVQLARVLSRLKIPFTFRMYAGTHEQTLWTAQAPGWLALLLDHLQAPR